MDINAIDSEIALKKILKMEQPDKFLFFLI